MSFKDQDSKKSLGEQLHDVEFIIMDESGKTTGESALPSCVKDPDPGSSRAPFGSGNRRKKLNKKCPKLKNLLPVPIFPAGLWIRI